MKFHAELTAHYSAVRARLWTPRLPSTKAKPEPASQPVHLASIEEVVAKWRKVDERLGRISSEAVLCATASYFGISVIELATSCSRVRDFVDMRDVAIYIMRALCKKSHRPITTFEVGQIMNRDHSSVITATKRVPKKMNKDAQFAKSVGDIMELLKPSEAAK